MREAGEVPDKRRQRLQAATRDVHARLDRTIMAADPFGDARRYGGFLTMQYRLHAASAPLYDMPELARIISDLAARRRHALFEADLADLGLPVPSDAETDLLAAAPVPYALGWLYVVEGSTLGAAFLAKAAARIGFDARHGARGLAEPAGGRGPSWRRFVAQLDEAEFDAAGEAAVADGASAAFGHAHRLAAAIA